MTQNQLTYWKNVEQERTNRANEDIKSRDSRSREREVDVKELAQQLNEVMGEAQRNRWNVQNGVDIANAVTGGVSNLGKSVSSVLGNVVPKASTPTTPTINWMKG